MMVPEKLNNIVPTFDLPITNANYEPNHNKKKNHIQEIKKKHAHGLRYELY